MTIMCSLQGFVKCLFSLRTVGSFEFKFFFGSIRKSLGDLDPQQVASRTTGHLQPCFRASRPTRFPHFLGGQENFNFLKNKKSNKT
jgi:hypothetical protein